MNLIGLNVMENGQTEKKNHVAHVGFEPTSLVFARQGASTNFITERGFSV